MLAIRIEYENESISLALYEGIKIDEFIDVITGSFHITESIIGLRDSNGVIFLPKYICMSAPNIPRTSYELLVKGHKNKFCIPKHLGSKPIPIIAREERIVDGDLKNVLRYLKMDGFITRAEEQSILNMFNKDNSELLHILNKYKASEDFQRLKGSLKQLTMKRVRPQIHWQENMRPRTDAGYRSRRPLSAARLTENANINSTQAMLIGAVHDLEKKSLLDEQIVCIIKTLILEENPEVIKLLNSYIAHIIGERELCPRLQRLSERMSTYIERPSSPLPRKSSLLEFVNNIASTYTQDREDIELLQKLIEYENEFVLSAFDVFESDQDQENLLDSLLRIVAKYKRMGITKDSVPAAGFYDGGILQPEIQRPIKTRERPKRAHQFTTEIDSGAPMEFPLDEGNSEEEKSEEVEEVTLPNVGLVYVTRGKKPKTKEMKVEEPNNITFKDFKKIGVLDNLKGELVGMLRWGLMNEESKLKDTLEGAYRIWKVTSDNKLLANTVEGVCTKFFESMLSESLSDEQIELYQSNRKNAKIIKMTKSLCKTGKIVEFIESLTGILNEFKKTVPEEALLMEDVKKIEEDVAIDILSALESDGKISKVDSDSLNELYKKRNKNVCKALDIFKQDHDFETLGESLTSIIKSKQEKSKKKKKYKTFRECIKFFKVALPS